MAKTRTSQSRASSSASGRRGAGSRDGAGKGRSGAAAGEGARGSAKPGEARDGARSSKPGKSSGGRPSTPGGKTGKPGSKAGSRPGSKAGSRPGSRPSGASSRDGARQADPYAEVKPPSRSATKRAAKDKQQLFAPNEREQREGVRLQKFIASTGISSRRHAEELISSGLVTVNGQIVKELGTRVFPGRDRVTVRGEPVTAEDKVYFVLNKPDEMVCSAAGSVDERGRPTVLSLMHGIPQRLYPVGRLDYRSRGVVILTNDGEVAAALTHPRHGIVKTYHVKFQGKLSPEQEDALREGVQLDDGAVTRPLAELFGFRETEANGWYQMGLTEGLNRQIRRMGDAIGHPVLKLIRVAIGDITTDGLEEGEFRPLSPTEIGQMLSTVKLEGIPKRETHTTSGVAPARQQIARKLPRPDGEERPRSTRPAKPAAAGNPAAKRGTSSARTDDRPGRGGQGRPTTGRPSGARGAKKSSARGPGKPRK